jgi:hypothetical protein
MPKPQNAVKGPFREIEAVKNVLETQYIMFIESNSSKFEISANMAKAHSGRSEISTRWYRLYSAAGRL